MPISVVCPNCNASIKAPDAALGKNVKCPKCEEMFVVKASATPPQPPKPPSPPKSKPKIDLFDEEEVTPPKKQKQTRNDEEDDTPRKPKKRVEHDDYDDEEPQRKGSKPAKKKPILLFVLIGIAFVSVVFIGGCLGLLYFIGSSEDKQTPIVKNDPEEKKGPGIINPPPIDKKNPPKDPKQPFPPTLKDPLDNETEQAIVKLGGKYGGFYRPVADSNFSFLGSREVAQKNLPGFDFYRPKDNKLGAFPKINVPFGLKINLDSDMPADLTELKTIQNLKHLELDNARDADFANLVGNQSLQSLVISRGQELTDGAMEHIAKIPNLQELYIYTSGITAKSVPTIGKMGQLTQLDISRIPIGSNEASSLSSLINLKYLRIASGKFGNGELAQLSGLSKLESLNLSQTSISDPGVQFVEGMKNLQRLDLSFTKVTPACFKSLTPLTKLNTLNVSDEILDDEAMRTLMKLKLFHVLSKNGAKSSDANPYGRPTSSEDVNTIALSFTKCTSAILKEFVIYPNVTHLFLSGIPINNNDIMFLKNFRRLEYVYLSNTNLDDTGLAHLTGIPTLIFLEAQKTKISATGIQQFQKAKPMSAILN